MKYALRRTSHISLDGKVNAPSFVRYSSLAAFLRLSNVEAFMLTASGIGYLNLVLSAGEEWLADDAACGP